MAAESNELDIRTQFNTAISLCKPKFWLVKTEGKTFKRNLQRLKALYVSCCIGTRKNERKPSYLQQLALIQCLFCEKLKFRSNKIDEDTGINKSLIRHLRSLDELFTISTQLVEFCKKTSELIGLLKRISNALNKINSDYESNTQQQCANSALTQLEENLQVLEKLKQFVTSKHALLTHYRQSRKGKKEKRYSTDIADYRGSVCNAIEISYETYNECLIDIYDNYEEIRTEIHNYAYDLLSLLYKIFEVQRFFKQYWDLYTSLTKSRAKKVDNIDEYIAFFQEKATEFNELLGDIYEEQRIYPVYQNDINEKKEEVLKAITDAPESFTAQLQFCLDQHKQFYDEFNECDILDESKSARAKFNNTRNKLRKIKRFKDQITRKLTLLQKIVEQCRCQISPDTKIYNTVTPDHFARAYIWNTNYYLDTVGHAAIETYINDEKVYISFWPIECKQYDISVKSRFIESYEEEIDPNGPGEQCEANKIVELRLLDVKAINLAFELFKSCGFNWGLLALDKVMNCAETVWFFLSIGGIQAYVNDQYSILDVFSDKFTACRLVTGQQTPNTLENLIEKAYAKEQSILQRKAASTNLSGEQQITTTTTASACVSSITSTHSITTGISKPSYRSTPTTVTTFNADENQSDKVLDEGQPNLCLSDHNAVNGDTQINVTGDSNNFEQRSPERFTDNSYADPKQEMSRLLYRREVIITRIYTTNHALTTLLQQLKKGNSYCHSYYVHLMQIATNLTGQLQRLEKVDKRIAYVNERILFRSIDNSVTVNREIRQEHGNFNEESFSCSIQRNFHGAVIISFSLNSDEAVNEVYLAGGFNKWLNADSGGIDKQLKWLMECTENYTWEICINREHLGCENYFKFVVIKNGNEYQWYPQIPNDNLSFLLEQPLNGQQMGRSVTTEALIAHGITNHTGVPNNGNWQYVDPEANDDADLQGGSEVRSSYSSSS